MSRTDHEPSPAPAKDDPVRTLLPTFTPPQAPPATVTGEEGTTPASPATDPAQWTPGQLPPAIRREAAAIARAAGLSSGSAGPAPTEPRVTPTETSSAGDQPAKPPSTADATALVIGILALATTVAAGLVRWQLRRRLREPSKAQRRDIAAPIARIMLRRVDLAQWGPDIGDALEAAAAAGAYIGDGPLLQPLSHVVDDGVPANLQEATP